jgi:diphosphomevalonate decarboxylase
MTLNQDDLCSKTTAVASPLFEPGVVRLWLNGKEEETSKSGRIQGAVAYLKKFAVEERKDYGIHMWSENNFPTAAGLASSASGFACLVRAVSHLLGADVHPECDLTIAARLGSGSACRSMLGGFVEWKMGKLEDGSDCVAREVMPVDHWDDIEVLVLVASDQKKLVSSTGGMQTSVKTSALLPARLKIVEEERIPGMKSAVRDRDFDRFARLTMADSNQFHSICLDTYPPIFYLKEVSAKIIHLVHAFNDMMIAEGKGHVLAYTFDAGPNAVLYVKREYVSRVLKYIRNFFPETPVRERKGDDLVRRSEAEDVTHFVENIKLEPSTPGSLRYIIHSTVCCRPFQQKQNHLTDAILMFLCPMAFVIHCVFVCRLVMAPASFPQTCSD